VEVKNMKYALSLIFILTFWNCSSTHNSSKLNNLETFCKLYGYVRYFHPSDEAGKINWEKFAIYGVEKISKISERDNLKTALEVLFKPIAPTIELNFDNNVNEIRNDTSAIDASDSNLVFWQHLGVRISQRSNMYQSKKVVGNLASNETWLFEKNPLNDRIFRKHIGSGISCMIPLALPLSKSDKVNSNNFSNLDSLMVDLSEINTYNLTANEEVVRLTNVIISWNVLQHFYPYFDVIKVDWEAQLTESLNEALENKNENEFYNTLRKMVAKLEDGHGVVTFRSETVQKGLPIKAEYIENQLLIVATKDSSLFNIGDIILSIDGISAKELLENTEELVSGSPQLKKYRALNIFDLGNEFSKVNVRIKRNNKFVSINAIRNEKKNLFANPIAEYNFPDIEELEKDIYYVNLATIDITTFQNFLPKLANAKGVIFDWRWDGKFGNKKERLSPVRHIFPHLIKEDIESAQWHIPTVIYPDRKNFSFTKSNWSIQPKEPFFTSKCIFIIQPSVVSYGETCMGIIEHYELAELVGQTTAGCNGNVNFIPLLGDFSIMWTGMKVLKHDGSQHHLIGIEPNYPVNKTIRAVVEKRDEYLEKALMIVKQ
jgi:Peptidase family S41